MLKAVIASTTFLWKKAEMNEVLAAIEANSREALTSLTAEQAMQLYTDRLVDSELIYGTVVEVESENAGWAKVYVLDQASNADAKGYPGFLRSKDLLAVDADYVNAKEKVAVIVPETELKFANHLRPVAFGTVLPLYEEKTDLYVVQTPQGLASLAKTATQKTDAYQGTAKTARMVELAKQFLEMPYVWAGTTGRGFDCSGFMYGLHRVNGITIPRDAIEQAENGTHVTRDTAEVGDLFLFAYEKGKGEVHHVGMYIGHDQFIHSQTPGSKVMITTLTGSKQYEPELAVVTRYWK